MKLLTKEDYLAAIPVNQDRGRGGGEEEQKEDDGNEFDK